MIALILAGFLALFAICNVVTWRTLLRLHPRRRRIVITLFIVCNLMWVP